MVIWKLGSLFYQYKCHFDNFLPVANNKGRFINHIENIKFCTYQMSKKLVPVLPHTVWCALASHQTMNFWLFLQQGLMTTSHSSIKWVVYLSSMGGMQINSNFPFDSTDE
jgi:hypothetical protein